MSSRNLTCVSFPPSPTASARARRSSVGLALCVAAVASLSACSAETTSTTSNLSPDAAVIDSPADASVSSDSGLADTPDAGAIADAGAFHEPDAGQLNLPDAGGGAEPDAGQAPDAGSAPDAGQAAVRFARDVQPIFNLRCTNSGCHGPGTGIDLTSAAVSHADLVGHVSEECGPTLRVAPGNPAGSYLIHKLEGAGPCFMGVRMPMSASPLSADELDVVSRWIAGGALND